MQIKKQALLKRFYLGGKKTTPWQKQQVASITRKVLFFIHAKCTKWIIKLIYIDVNTGISQCSEILNNTPANLQSLSRQNL